MIYLVSKVEEKKGKNPPHNPYWAMTLIGDDAVTHENVTTFNKVGEGMKIEGEVIFKEGGKFKNFEAKQTAQQTARTNFGARQKDESIIKAQERKEQGIAKAQDRSAWMWAKNNATELLKNHPALQGKTAEEMATAVIKLATYIYNGEPTEPFSSFEAPKHVTSPTPEHPHGIDVYNHPLTTDAERQAMDEEDAPPVDIRDMDLSDIPF